ncbi:hypothetical protein [Helicobacter burdigaliensis]
MFKRIKRNGLEFLVNLFRFALRFACMPRRTSPPRNNKNNLIR